MRSQKSRNQTTKKQRIDFESLEGPVLLKVFGAHTLIAMGMALRHLKTQRRYLSNGTY